MSFMNFNIENAKTFRMEWKKNYYNMAHLFTEILIMSKACSLVILFIQFFSYIF